MASADLCFQKSSLMSRDLCFYFKKRPLYGLWAAFLMKWTEVAPSLQDSAKKSVSNQQLKEWAYTRPHELNHIIVEHFILQISNRWGSNRQEEGSRFVLSRSRRIDSGQYTCIAANGVGQPASAQITLRVQCKLF